MDHKVPLKAGKNNQDVRKNSLGSEKLDRWSGNSNGQQSETKNDAYQNSLAKILGYSQQLNQIGQNV